MARACSICTDDRREAIERALTSTRPLLRIAEEYGLAESSLRRHRENHLAPALAEALARRADVDADKLMAWVAGIHERTLMAIVRTEGARDWPNFRALIREARENVALLGKLAGILDAGPAVAIDARRQVAVLSNLSDDDLKSLAAAAREGQLEQAADSLGLPSPHEAVPVPVPAEREEAEWRPAT